MSVTPTPLPSPGQGNPRHCPARCASLAGLPTTPPGDGVWVYEVARFFQLNLIGSELNLTYFQFLTSKKGKGNQHSDFPADPHVSTIRARLRLTSEFGWDQVL